MSDEELEAFIECNSEIAAIRKANIRKQKMGILSTLSISNFLGTPRDPIR